MTDQPMHPPNAGARILGLETSCDETAAAIVADGFRVCGNVIASQHDLHERYGGVVPEIASRAHLERLQPVIEAALEQAGITLADLDAVAVGNRPGLVGSLIVGVSAAKALAWSLHVPLIGVDHIRAHLYAAALCLDVHSLADPIPFPALGLVASGGHTTLYHVESATSMSRLGGTIDDAIGEAFDKAAVILGLPYPGGPNIDRAARLGDPRSLELPRSLLEPGSLDFSFSGLKTALLYAVRGHPQGRGRSARFPRSAASLSEQQQRDYAASFQAAAVDAVAIKLGWALDQLAQEGRPARSIVLGGGVTANRELRERVEALGRERDVTVRLPAMPLCVDNAAMIAGLAHHLWADGELSDLTLPAIATGR